MLLYTNYVNINKKYVYFGCLLTKSHSKKPFSNFKAIRLGL